MNEEQENEISKMEDELDIGKIFFKQINRFFDAVFKDNTIKKF